MNKINELKQERAALVEQQRAIVDAADAEKREFTAEETEKFDKIESDFADLSEQIKRAEKSEEIRASLKGREEEMKRTTPVIRADIESGSNVNPLATDEYRDIYMNFMRHGKGSLYPNEQRALQVGTDSEGGYTVPDEFEAMLVRALEDNNVMRGVCKVIKTNNGTLDIPTVASRGAAAWTAEEGAFNESDDAFGIVQISAYKASRVIKVSEELMGDSAFDMQGYVADSFGRSFGILEEAAFIVGDGSAKPTGICGAAGTGVTAASATAVTTDEIMEFYHSLGRAYRSKAHFMMKDATALIIRKLKNGDGQYIWQPGLQAGQPDMLLGRPVLISDNMAAATTGNDAILFADFSYYWIADRGNRVFKRLDELYAATGQVGFRAWQRVDGKLTLAAAAKVLVMG